MSLQSSETQPRLKQHISPKLKSAVLDGARSLDSQDSLLSLRAMENLDIYIQVKCTNFIHYKQKFNKNYKHTSTSFKYNL